MRWLGIDVGLVLIALAALGGLAGSLWRRLGTLGRDIERLRSRMGQATSGLDDPTSDPGGATTDAARQHFARRG